MYTYPHHTENLINNAEAIKRNEKVKILGVILQSYD